MTYQQLFNSLTEEQKNQDVTVWDSYEQEYFPVRYVSTKGEEDVEKAYKVNPETLLLVF